MADIKERYRDTFLPLVNSFVEGLNAEQYREIPEIFLPLYGKNFERSTPKIAFVGRDTLSWGDMADFIKDAQRKPEEAIFRNLAEFQNLDFKGYMGKSERNYWGFIFKVLSHLHGLNNWKDLPTGKRDEILEQIAWGNTYAMTNTNAFKKTEQFNLAEFKTLKNRSNAFNSFEHIYNVLEPDLVILMNWQASEKRVAATETNCKDMQLEKHIWHYFFPDAGRHVIQVPHPTYIARSGKYDFDDFARNVAQIAKQKLNEK